MKQYEHLFGLFIAHLEVYKKALEGKTPKELYEPENYILDLGGKRLRPLLALIACDLFGKKPEAALNSALCVELFHNFSLMHDDILDEAPLRRNKETVHKKWNTNIAILSGDVMLVKAFSVLENYSDAEFKLQSGLLTKTAVQVCEGQQLDMNFESLSTGQAGGNLVTVSEYLDMITKKTAVLLACSLQMGAINAGAGRADRENIYEFGKHLGIAFQLMDDMLDTFSENADSFGKQIGGDIIAGKKTFLLLKTLELVDETKKNELNKFLQLNKENSEEKIKGVKAIFEEFDVKKHCVAKADEHTQIAITHLNKTSAPEDKKEHLKQFAFTLLNRQI